jgi:Zn-finger nucleic acid-binding protein
MTPYRDAPPEIHCPRCGDGLDTVREGLAGCLSCHGLWLSTTALELAFGKRVWPLGTNAWWKRELVCPICGNEMDAIMANEVLVDRCMRHGVWFDPGELGRLLGAPEAEELAAFYRQIAPGNTMPELAARQKIREREREERRREAEREAEAETADVEAAITRYVSKVSRLRAELQEAEAVLAAARRKRDGR